MGIPFLILERIVMHRFILDQHAEGERARTIDELPLEDFYGDGVILDMRHKEPRSGITVEDVKKALEDMDYMIKPRDIVLIMTGYDKHIYTEKYLSD